MASGKQVHSYLLIWNTWIIYQPGISVYSTQLKTRQYIRDTVQLYDIGQIIQQVVLVCQKLADVT